MCGDAEVKVEAHEDLAGAGVKEQGTWSQRRPIPADAKICANLEKSPDSITRSSSIAAMYQRNMCPTVGLLRRSLIADVSSVVNGPARAFSVSVRRAEEQPSSASPSAPGTSTRFSQLMMDRS
jgi:hypothetical protein